MLHKKEYQFYINNIDKFEYYLYLDQDSQQSGISSIFSQSLVFINKCYQASIGETHWFWFNQVKAQQVFIRYYQDRDFSDAQLHKKIHSLSQKTLLNNSIPSSVSERMLFQILADSFGLNSELEGATGIDPLLFLDSFIKQKKETGVGIPGITDELHEMIQGAIQIESSASNFRSNLQAKLEEAMSSKKRVLLPAGWVGIPGGHRMYIECIPLDKLTADVRFFNEGRGLEYLNGKQVGVKEKYSPGCELKDVSKGNLLSPAFVEALDELLHRHIDLSGKRTEYGPNDIYGGVIDVLKPKKIIPWIGDKEEMGMQLAGTCTWKSMMAFLKTYMNHKDYKIFKSEIRSHLLIECALTQPTPSIKIYRMIKKGTQKFSRSLRKLRTAGFVDDSYIINMKKSLKPIFEWIELHQATLESKQKLEIPVTKEPLSSNVAIPTIQIEKPSMIEQPEIQVVAQSLADFCRTASLDDKDLSNTIQQSVKHFQQAFENSQDTSLNTSCIHFVKRLSMDPVWWASFVKNSPKETEGVIENLGCIADLFFKSCFMVPNANLVHPERAYVLLKILHLQELLVKNLKPDGTELTFSSNWNYDSKPFFSLYDSKMQQETAILLKKKEGTLEKDARREHDDSFYRKHDPNVHFFSPWSYHQNHEFPREKMFSLVEGFEKKLRVEYPDFDILNKEQQNIRIYTSRHLPAWFNAMKNTFHCSYYFSRCPVAKLPGINRSTDLTFSSYFVSYDNKSGSRGTDILWKLEGITDEIYNHYPKMKGFDSKRFFAHPWEYSSSHSHFQSSSIKEVATYRQGNFEKQLLTTDLNLKKRGIDLPAEEFKELARITLSKDLQLIEALEYFTKHPEKIANTDYQILFRSYFYRQNLLPHDLKELPGLGQKLASFIRNTYETYRLQHDIQPMIFLLQQSRYLKQFCIDSKCILQSDFPDFRKELRSLLKQNSLTPEERALVYHELIAGFCKEDVLNDNDIRDILIGITYASQYPLPLFWRNVETEKEIRETIEIHRTALGKALVNKETPNETLINEILSHSFPNEKPKKWKIIKAENGIQFETDGETVPLVYNPLHNVFYTKDLPSPIPENIRENAYFAQLFPGTTLGLIEDGYYTFTDKQGFSVRVASQKDGVIIERKMKGNWYRFVPRESLEKEVKQQGKEKGEEIVENALTSRYLVNTCSHWLSLTSDHLLLTDRKTHTLMYEGTVGYGMRVKEISTLDSEKLCLGAPSNLFDHFEDRSYVEYWYDSETSALKQIRLPRYKLSFSMKNDQLISDQFPGFQLLLDGSVPILGSFSHHLLLESSQGKRKVLLPEMTFSMPNRKEVLLPRFDLERHLNKGNHTVFRYCEYTMNEKGWLEGTCKKDSLYLASILAMVQEYSSAAKILRKRGEKLSPYTQEEQEVLQTLASNDKVTGDKDANAAALRVYAGYLLLKNLASRGEKLKDKDIESLRDNYQDYLQLYQNATALKLTNEEEIFLLRTLLKKQPKDALVIRWNQLLPNATLPVPTIKKTKFDLSCTQPHRLELSLGCQTTSLFSFVKDSLSQNYMITRPRDALEKDFSRYFLIATGNDSAEKERLKQSLNFLHYSSDSQDRSLYQLYTALLTFPTAFTPPSSNVGAIKRETDEWINATIQKAESLLSKLPSNSVEIPTKDLKFIDHPLDEKTTVPKAYALSFQMPIHKPFTKGCADLFHESAVEVDPSFADLQKLLMKASKTDDIPLKGECDRLLDDLDDYISKPIKTYSLKQEALAKIEAAAKEDQKNEELEVKKLEAELLSLANTKHKAPIDRALTKLMKEGDVLKPLTLNEVLVSFAREDALRLQQRNPALSSEDVNSLHAKAALYLLKATHLQQRNRVLKLVDKIGKKTTGALVEELFVALQPRAYDPSKSKSYLVFEYIVDIMIRKDQVDKVDDFLKSGNINLIAEMIMGAGKSKVLLPLLALLRANGVDLSLLIILESLYESFAHDTQQVNDDAFDQKLKGIYFDRNTDCSAESLKILLDDLKTIIRDKDCIVMTSKSVGCLVLKFIEKIIAHLNQKEIPQKYPEDILLMREIINIIRKQGVPMLDEADTILNILLEICFSMGEPSSPSTIEIEAHQLLFEIIHGDPEIKKLARLESDPHPDVTAPTLSEELYHNKLKQPLFKQLLLKLQKGGLFSDTTLNAKVKLFFNNFKDKDNELVEAFIFRTKGKENEAQKYFDQLTDPDIKDLLALYGEQISHLLSHTLTQECDKNYGIDEKAKNSLPIPFSAANTPNRGSLFKNRHVMMDYTFQTASKKGITRQEIRNEIERLQAKAMHEMADKVELKDTQAWKTFSFIRGDLDIPLFNLRDSHYDSLYQKVNNTIASKHEFVAKVFLPQMKIYANMINWNPQNMGSFFDKIDGFTGTLWNKYSMHPSLTPKPEKGVDMATIALLWAQSRSDVHVLDDGKEESLLKQIIALGCDGIIDMAGCFKEGGSEKTAESMNAQTKRPVVHYNLEGDQMVVHGEKKMPLAASSWSEDEWLVYYDDKHTTGADVRQKIDSMNALTIGRKTKLRDLLQSARRLRKLGRAQRVKFVMTHEVEDLIRQSTGLDKKSKITFEHILLFAIYNQSSQQGKDAFRGAVQQIWNIPQMMFLDLLLTKDSLPSKAGEMLKTLWLKQANKPPRELYGTIPVEKPAKEVLAKQGNACKDYLKSMFDLKSDDKSIEAIDKIQLNKTLLPPTVVDGALSDENQSMEVESQLQTDTNIEVETQAYNEDAITELRSAAGKILDFCDTVKRDLYCDDKLPTFPLQRFFEGEKEFKDIADAFEGIYITTNVLAQDKDQKVVKLFGSYRTPLHHLYVESDGKVILMSHYETQFFKETKEYYNLTLGFIDDQQKVNKKLLSNIVKIKFLNGESNNYTKEEQKLLQEWIDKVGKDKLKHLFLRHILSGLPLKLTTYNNSPLQRILG